MSGDGFPCWVAADPNGVRCLDWESVALVETGTTGVGIEFRDGRRIDALDARIARDVPTFHRAILAAIIAREVATLPPC